MLAFKLCVWGVGGGQKCLEFLAEVSSDAFNITISYMYDE